MKILHANIWPNGGNLKSAKWPTNKPILFAWPTTYSRTPLHFYSLFLSLTVSPSLPLEFSKVKPTLAPLSWQPATVSKSLVIDFCCGPYESNTQCQSWQRLSRTVCPELSYQIDRLHCLLRFHL